MQRLFFAQNYNKYAKFFVIFVIYLSVMKYYFIYNKKMIYSNHKRNEHPLLYV